MADCQSAKLYSAQFFFYPFPPFETSPRLSAELCMKRRKQTTKMAVVHASAGSLPVSSEKFGIW